MARLFDDASSQYLEHAAAALAGVPITMACWFQSDDATVSQGLMSIGRADVDDNFFELQAAGTVAGDPIRAHTESTSGAGVADTSSGYSVDTWHHACAVFAAVDDRRAYIDGGSKGTGATSVTPASLAITDVGRAARSVNNRYTSGRIAEAAVWNVALDDSEVAALAKGFSPLLIRPQSLVAYWPLFGNDASELDRWKSRFDLTVTGATKAAHPRMFYPHQLP